MKLVAALLILVFFGCAGPSEAPFIEVRGWGTMREVLREGDTRGRVPLVAVVEDHTWGVGALEGLEGEITIVDGEVSIAQVVDGELVLRGLRKRDEASLLVLAEVSAWHEDSLPQVRGLRDLETVLEGRVRLAGLDPGLTPVPVHVEGTFERLSLHVLDGSCPVARPDGPPPWRWEGGGARGGLVGVYAEGQGGVMTHHGQRLHLHAVVVDPDGRVLSGHVDDVALGEGSSLFLPAPDGAPVQGGLRVETGS